MSQESSDAHTITLRPRDTSPAEARAFVLACLQSFGLNDDLLSERVRLCTSEAATNAVVHARTDFEVSVALLSSPRRVRVTVSDRGDRSDPLPGRLDAGRGVAIVTRLADAASFTRTQSCGMTAEFEFGV